jgi:hypothetical protein
MRKAIQLRAILRSAVLQALAVGWGAPLGCGGVIAPNEARAHDHDGAPLPDTAQTDAGIPFAADVSSPSSFVEGGPDWWSVEVPREAGSWTLDDGALDAAVSDSWATGDSAVADSGGLIDGAASDGSCLLIGPSGPCRAIYSCLPPDLVVGTNASCVSTCGGPANLGCTVTPVDAGLYDIQCLCGGGRFPAGLELAGGGTGSDAVGLLLAQNAALEAAAVRAFARLARELAAHHAPASFVARARRAARQEATHAWLLRSAAAARGCSVPRTRAERWNGTRTLRELAKENAVEGCGREAIGAAQLELQSLLATDAALRPVLATIAADEREHAELAWELRQWFESQLDAAGCAEVRATYEAFLADCADHVPEAGAKVAKSLGLPSPAQWKVLVAAVRAGMGELMAS